MTSKITIQEVEDTTGKNKNYKIRHCLFCQQGIQQQIIRHLERKHKDEPEVKILMALPSGSKERKEMCNKLHNEGNFQHNMEVLEKQEGVLLVTRRSKKNTNTFKDYLPCTHCLGFYNKDDISRHCKSTCKFRGPTMTKSAVKLGKEVVAIHMGTTSKEFASLLAKMKNEEYVETIQADSLLKSYAQTLIDKYAIKKGPDNLIREKLREMTKLFLELKESNNNLTFLEIFKPENFDSVIFAVHSLTGRGTGIKSPSLALKFGHGLKKVARILIGQSLRRRDEVAKKNAEDFLILMENEWTEKVSRNALKTLADKKFNKPQDIPLTEDLVNLVTKICLEMSELSSLNELSPTDFR